MYSTVHVFEIFGMEERHSICTEGGFVAVLECSCGNFDRLKYLYERSIF